MKREVKYEITEMHDEGYVYSIYRYNVREMVRFMGAWVYSGVGRFCKTSEECMDWIRAQMQEVIA